MVEFTDAYPDVLRRARVHLNEGEYARALDAAREASDGNGPVAEGARRLAGCLMIVEGQYRRGLELLERSRHSDTEPRFPDMTYRKSFPHESEVVRIAVGLLESLALGMSPSEVAGSGSAFAASNTLNSLEMLSDALREEGRRDAAELVEEYRVRWDEHEN